MEIKFYGHACFSIEDKSVKVLMDPFDPTVNSSAPGWDAHMVTISNEELGHSHYKGVKGDPMVFRWPGEYETKGVHVKGIHSAYQTEQGKEEENNIFVLHFSGIKFCHLGLQTAKLTAEQLEQIGDVDVLFVPVGSKNVQNSKKAKEIIDQIEPRVIIPMLYMTEGDKKELPPLSIFLSEMASSNVEPIDSFKFKKSELPEDNTKVVVMNVAA